MKINNTTRVIIIIILILITIAAFIIIKYASFGEYSPNLVEEDYVEPKKAVGINEYEVVNISEETMIRTYFTVFINYMLESPEKAYNLLNEDYKNLKYSTLNSFNEYIKNATNNYNIYPEISTYRVDYKDNKTIYYIFDTNKNEYIFSVDAVMVYSVYLDEETIEIE